MTTEAALDQGREFFRRQQWTDAHLQLSAADRDSRLVPQDPARLATAAYMTGDDDESAEVWARAHHEFMARGNPAAAARSALWLAFELLVRGDMAPARGWLARAGRVLNQAGDCAERGLAIALDA